MNIELIFIRKLSNLFLKFKQEMPSRQQKSEKKGSAKYLMLGPNHILISLRCDDRRSPGHGNVSRSFLN